jgi:hypothetical protein
MERFLQRHASRAGGAYTVLCVCVPFSKPRNKGRRHTNQCLRHPPIDKRCGIKGRADGQSNTVRGYPPGLALGRPDGA